MNAHTPLPVQFWSMKSAVEQIQKCAFECEGGPLENNDAWRWLVGITSVGPEFWPGQGVHFEVVAEAAGKKLTQWMHFYVVGCHMDSTSEARIWTYDLSYDPPAPYHYGTVHFQRVRSEKLRAQMPALLSSTHKTPPR